MVEAPPVTPYAVRAGNRPNAHPVVDAGLVREQLSDVDACSRVIAAAVPEIALGLWSLRNVALRSRWTHHDTTLVNAVAVVQDHAERSRFEYDLLLKHDPQRGGWHADRAARLLREAAPESSPWAVMRTFGVDRNGTLVAEMVRGELWRHRLKRSGAFEDLGAITNMLVGLQSCSADLEIAPDLLPPTRRELDELALLASDCPHLGASIDRLAPLLLDALQPSVCGPLLPGHGDLHPKNVFLGSESAEHTSRTVIVDLDAVGLQEPAVDVGYAAAHLVISCRHLGLPFARGIALARELWDSYVQAGGVAADDRIATQIARIY